MMLLMIGVTLILTLMAISAHPDAPGDRPVERFERLIELEDFIFPSESETPEHKSDVNMVD